MPLAGFDNRLRFLVAMIGVLMLTLIGQLWMLQLSSRVSADDDSDAPLWMRFTTSAMQNRTKIVRTPAPRGMIYDRTGAVLVENRPEWNVMVTPADLPAAASDRDGMILQLASTLRDTGVTTAELRARFDDIRLQMPVRPVLLCDAGRDVTLRQVAEIEERRLDLPGVSIVEEFRRNYVNDNLASHVLGYARAISDEQYEDHRDLQYPDLATEPDPIAEMLGGDPIYGPASDYGQTGIEASCELDGAVDPPMPILQGRRGREIWEVDSRARPLRLISERLPTEGAGVRLTIDLRLQKYAERLLASRVGSRLTGAIILMDVNSGDILAMSSKPSIDPNRWVGGFTPEEFSKLIDDPRKPLYNQAIAGTYPPGSIFKMISLFAALQTTSVTPSQRYYCDGKINLGAHHTPYRCWKREGHKTLDMYGGMAQSCDVYFYKLVTEAGTSSDNIAKYARLFGLGEPTGCGLPGEQAGLVPDRRWKEDADMPEGEDNIWTTGNTVQYIIGQSFLMATPLQMTVVTAAVANGGQVLRPRVVREITWPEHMNRAPTVTQPEVVRTIEASDGTFAVVQRGMRLAVTSRSGTAHNLVDTGIGLAGKTGSAQWRLDRKTHAWFACYAPYENPRFAVVCFVSEGGHGGETAAPPAAALIKAALRLYPNGCPVKPATPADDEPDTEAPS